MPLALTRKPFEKILIGDDITLWVSAVRGKLVTICIDAPEHVEIMREELTRDPDIDLPPPKG